MRKLLELLSNSTVRDDAVVQRLRDRVSEIEEENLHLRRLDETVRRTARLFDLVLEKSHEAIVLVTPDMVVLRLIHSAVGYKESEVLGQSVMSIIHPDDIASLKNKFLQLVNGQSKSLDCQFRLKKSDGTWAWVKGEMTDMLDDPDVQAILLNARNITEEKKQAAAADWLRAFRACSEYALFSKSREGVILDWNPGAQKAFGYSAGEVVGQNISMLVPPELLAEESSERERLMFGEEIPAALTVRVRKDGRRVEIYRQLFPVWNSQGGVEVIAHVSHVIRLLD